VDGHRSARPKSRFHGSVVTPLELGDLGPILTETGEPESHAQTRALLDVLTQPRPKAVIGIVELNHRPHGCVGQFEELLDRFVECEIMRMSCFP